MTTFISLKCKLRYAIPQQYMDSRPIILAPLIGWGFLGLCLPEGSSCYVFSANLPPQSGKLWSSSCSGVSHVESLRGLKGSGHFGEDTSQP